jgi:hypothetical protein
MPGLVGAMMRIQSPYAVELRAQMGVSLDKGGGYINLHWKGE